MANPEHVAILKKSAEVWNRWREEKPEIRPDLSEADLGGADLSGADLRRADLGGTDLSGAKLVGADLAGAKLSDANLCVADLSVADLSRADLSGTDSREADLFGADLRGADFREADLSGANLSEANLHGANLSGAGVFRANLSGANVSEANFIEANLIEANLIRANLSAAVLASADLTGATVGYTIFTNTDLSRVKGLGALDHRGPSSIGIDTIYKSKGKISHSFLRGAGVPDNFIEYMASLVGTGIEFYSLFISYSTKDQTFADRLYADLQAKGVRCWFAPHDMQSGKKVHEQIDEAIRMYDKLLLVLSPDSMESEWVKEEIFKAREKEIRESRRVLFPIRLCSFEALRDWKLVDGDSGKDLAREIREYFIPDFCNWKDHDAYRIAFDRLLKDLQGKPDPSPA